MMSASEQHVYPPAIDVQDLVKVYPGGTRALAAVAVTALILVPATVAAFRTATR
jgi:hypothetical protein